MVPNVKEIVELEAQIWDALKSGDVESDRALLTEDFLGVYPSGFWSKTAHCDQMKDGPLIAEYRISEERLLHLSDSCVLLTYRAHYSWFSKPEKTAQMLISSLWQQVDGKWKNRFSQDTLAASSQ